MDYIELWKRFTVLIPLKYLVKDLFKSEKWMKVKSEEFLLLSIKLKVICAKYSSKIKCYNETSC